MEPNSKASRCLAVLADGPATTEEVALELGLSVRITSAHLGNLVKRNKAVKRRNYSDSLPNKHMLWMLPEHALP